MLPQAGTVIPAGSVVVASPHAVFNCACVIPIALSSSAPEKFAPVSTAPLAPAICHLLSDLHVEVASGRDLHDLQDSVEALFQQFHDDGYEWRTIPQGTEFDETLRAEFDTYGLVKPGEPIFTRRAALRRQGQLLQKGELRRVRSG